MSVTTVTEPPSVVIVADDSQPQNPHITDSSPYYSKDVESAHTCPPFYVPQPSHVDEHFRDIHCLGPITLHRIFTVLWIAAIMATFYFLQDVIWPTRPVPDQNTHKWFAWPYLGIIWLVSLPTAILTVVGNLFFRYNTKLDEVQPNTHKIAFRIVSRGLNKDVLLETIRRCQFEMSRNPMFPYLIEIVTDSDVFKAPMDADVVHLKVPNAYKTNHNTLFKARALNYACEHSLMPPTTWIVHLDEETQPTSSGVKGIADFVAKCEQNADYTRIGQGTILYNRAFYKHPFLTLADMRRTGDDFGHYYLQHRLGFTLFGLHGAFIVCRQDSEAAIGFDLGPAGSITEDAWWVLLAMKKGYRTGWVDGNLEEQSTQSLMDFLKQRRRWYYGLCKVCIQCPVPIKYRLAVGFNTLTWLMVPFILPLQVGYMILLYIYDLPVPFAIRILTNFIVASSTLLYISGLICNLRETRISWWKTPFWLVLMVIAFPFCLGMEILGVLMSFFAGCSQNGKGFHVVKKSAKSVSDSDESMENSDDSDTNGDMMVTDLSLRE